MTFLELAIVLLNVLLACCGAIWLVSKSLKALSAKRVGKVFTRWDDKTEKS